MKDTRKCKWCNHLFEYDQKAEYKLLCSNCASQKHRNFEKAELMCKKKHKKLLMHHLNHQEKK